MSLSIQARIDLEDLVLSEFAGICLELKCSQGDLENSVVFMRRIYPGFLKFLERSTSEWTAEQKELIKELTGREMVLE